MLDGWSAHDVVRVPQPLRSRDGGWAAYGWAAHRWLSGRTAEAGADPAAFRRTVQAFHEAVAGLERPAFLDHRDDVWTCGTGSPGRAGPRAAPVPAACCPRRWPTLGPRPRPRRWSTATSGATCCGRPGCTDAVIDWPVYFRPWGFSLAVAAGDAVAWKGARRACWTPGRTCPTGTSCCSGRSSTASPPGGRWRRAARPPQMTTSTSPRAVRPWRWCYGVSSEVAERPTRALDSQFDKYLPGTYSCLIDK